MHLNADADIDTAALDAAVDRTYKAIWAAPEGPSRQAAARDYFQARRDRDHAIHTATTGQPPPPQGAAEWRAERAEEQAGYWEARAHRAIERNRTLLRLLYKSGHMPAPGELDAIEKREGRA